MLTKKSTEKLIEEVVDKKLTDLREMLYEGGAIDAMAFNGTNPCWFVPTPEIRDAHKKINAILDHLKLNLVRVPEKKEKLVCVKRSPK